MSEHPPIPPRVVAPAEPALGSLVDSRFASRPLEDYSDTLSAGQIQPPTARGPGDGLGELLGVDRLDEVEIEADLGRAAPGLGLAVAGQGDQEDPSTGSGAAHSPGDLVAIHPRQADVDEHD